MEKLADKAALLLLATLTAGAAFGFGPVVLPFLICLLLSILGSLLSRDIAAIVIFAGYLIVGIFYPVWLLFLPVLSYDFTRRPLFLLGLASLPPLFLYVPYTFALLTAALFVLAFRMNIGTVLAVKMREKYHTTEDSSREAALTHERQRREMFERQELQREAARLEERNRIAREIHDSVGHVLSRCILQTGALIATAPDDATREGLILLKENLSSGMDSIRRSVHDLHEDVYDLEAEIQKLTSAFTLCPLEFRYSAKSLLPQDYNKLILSAVQECLSNVMKHSSATAVTVSFRELPAFYQLVVEDNGSVAERRRGTQPAAGDGKGLGLKSMEERVKKFGGVFSVTRENGFRVFLSLPKPTGR